MLRPAPPNVNDFRNWAASGPKPGIRTQTLRGRFRETMSRRRRADAIDEDGSEAFRLHVGGPAGRPVAKSGVGFAAPGHRL
jgi:hypothetical protein